MKKQKIVFIGLNITVPLIVGAVLYYLISPEAIFVKIIDQMIGREVHKTTIFIRSGMLRVVRFYFLDMCWAYALTFSVYIILGNKTAELKKSFILAGFFSAAMELLQLSSVVKGTFDVLDILCEVLAAGIAVFIIKYAHEEANEK